MKKSKKTTRSKKVVEIRPLTRADIPDVIAIQRACYPHIAPWTPAQIEEQLDIFAAGQLGVTYDGKLIATSTSMIVDGASVSEPHTFADVCPDDSIRLHDPEGDTLYGLDIVVIPKHRGKKMARRLYDARKRLARELNLRGMVFGGRMPNYAAHARELTPEQYLERVLQKTLRDPVVTTQRANGFTIDAVMRDYLPEDTDSGGHALLMSWRNPDFNPVGRAARATIRVASVQYEMRPVSSFEDFARQVEFFVDTASEHRADFVVFPELLTTQLLGLVPGGRPALAARRLHEFTPAYLRLFSELAIRFAVNVIAGSHLVVEDGALYNDAHVFHRDGRVDRQRKIHVTPGEERWWGVRPGRRIAPIQTDCGPIGVAICYDVEFPEYVRLLREGGARVVFVPYNTDLRSGHVRVRSCAQARAIENHVYVVTSGACGNLPMVEGADIHYAQSAILTPSDIPFARDAVAAEANPNVETMLVHDLDIALLRRTERTGTVRPWLDRRRDLYQIAYTGD